MTHQTEQYHQKDVSNDLVYPMQQYLVLEYTIQTRPRKSQSEVYRHYRKVNTQYYGISVQEIRKKQQYGRYYGLQTHAKHQLLQVILDIVPYISHGISSNHVLQATYM